MTEEAGMTQMVTIRLENRLPEITRLVKEVEAFGVAHDLPAGAVFKLNLALDELLTNTIEYGYEDGEPHEIVVEVVLADGAVAVEVIDDGRAYDPTQKPDPDISLGLEERPIGGLGILFAKRMMDRVDYRRDGKHNRLRLLRRLGGDGSGDPGGVSGAAGQD